MKLTQKMVLLRELIPREGLEMLLTASEMGDEAEVDNIQRILDKRIGALARFDSLHCSQAA